eukprot:jgi/Chrzof1/8296/Cz03g05080.t1
MASYEAELQQAAVGEDAAFARAAANAIPASTEEQERHDPELPGINRDTDNPSVESYNQLVADTTRDEDIGSTWRNLGKDYVGTYQDPVGGQAASSGQDIAATTGVPHTTVGAYGEQRHDGAEGSLNVTPHTTRGAPDDIIS